jgi:hypothetical protein
MIIIFILHFVMRAAARHEGSARRVNQRLVLRASLSSSYQVPLINSASLSRLVAFLLSAGLFIIPHKWVVGPRARTPLPPVYMTTGFSVVLTVSLQKEYDLALTSRYHKMPPSPKLF